MPAIEIKHSDAFLRPLLYDPNDDGFRVEERIGNDSSLHQKCVLSLQHLLDVLLHLLKGRHFSQIPEIIKDYQRE